MTHDSLWGTPSQMLLVQATTIRLYCLPRFATAPEFLVLPYFGEPRQKGTSHRVYRTPWPGDPRVNIQSAKGKAKPYQVRQVIKAIEKLEGRQ